MEVFKYLITQKMPISRPITARGYCENAENPPTLPDLTATPGFPILHILSAWVESGGLYSSPTSAETTAGLSVGLTKDIVLLSLPLIFFF